MEEQKTVLVTGGSGFIASHCIIKLTAAGYKVRSTVRDLTRTNKLNQVISDGLHQYEGQSELSIDWKVVKDSNFELDKDAYDFFTLEVFENLKPELEDKGFVEVEDIHRGNYYSRDVYRMIVSTPPFYLASHEFFRMNIEDYYDNYYPNDSYEYEFNQPRVLIGFRLRDIIK